MPRATNGWDIAAFAKLAGLFLLAHCLSGCAHDGADLAQPRLIMVPTCECLSTQEKAELPGRAELGDARAARRLGEGHLYIPEERHRAFFWTRVAIELGDVSAMHFMVLLTRTTAGPYTCQQSIYWTERWLSQFKPPEPVEGSEPIAGSSKIRQAMADVETFRANIAAGKSCR